VSAPSERARLCVALLLLLLPLPLLLPASLFPTAAAQLADAKKQQPEKKELKKGSQTLPRRCRAPFLWARSISRTFYVQC